MIERPQSADSLLDPRAIRHQIIAETNRLGILRPMDDYNLLQKLKVMQRQSKLDFATTVNEHVAAFAQHAFQTSPRWKAVIAGRTELKEIQELLARGEVLSPEEAALVRASLERTPVISLRPDVSTASRVSRHEPSAPPERLASPSPPKYENAADKAPAVETASMTPPQDEPVGIVDRVAMATIRTFLGAVHGEYKKAATYFAHRGAQTRSANYGGSRSHTYMDMLRSARTLREFNEARRDFRSRHAKPESAHDEYGGLLRIAGRRLAWIPYLGTFLESKVREDDKMMREAEFKYPDDVRRLYTQDDGSVSSSTNKQE